MKTRQYESVIIINAALEEPQIESALSRVRETITSNGGEINDFENWGRKRLAYPIQKAKTGYYTIFRFTAPSDAVAKIERMFRLDEEIFRFLTVTLDKEALENIEKKKTEKARQLQQEKEEKERLAKEAVEAAEAAEKEKETPEAEEDTTVEEEVKAEDSEAAPESNNEETN